MASSTASLSALVRVFFLSSLAMPDRFLPSTPHAPRFSKVSTPLARLSIWSGVRVPRK